MSFSTLLGMENELKECNRLLRENNEMLREILSYMQKYSTDEYRMREDLRAFSINVCANIVVDQMEQNDELRRKVTERLNLKSTK